jgi:molecular chaperone GrpE
VRRVRDAIEAIRRRGRAPVHEETMETDARAEAPAAERDVPTSPEFASDGLAAELAAAQRLADERFRELQYAHAETENVRKRAERIAADRLTAGRRALLGKFLPVIDNLQRSLSYDDSEGLRGGLQATLKGFEALLASEGVKTLELLGKPFDPHVAEAIATRESADVEDDVVLEEAQRGYTLGEDLLRPAMVVVSKRSEGSAGGAS